MRPFFYLIFFLCLPLSLFAQSHKLSGSVTDSKNRPLKGASVYLDNTLDGGTTDSNGHFQFTTTEQGQQVIAVSATGYQNAGEPITIKGDMTQIDLRMKANPRQLEGITVTAGAYEAGTEKGKTILSSLDIVTTAGAQADVVRAIQTLPGAQQQGTQSGLFIRGGDATEAAIIVDGLVQQDAFTTTAPGVAGRSRFSPFQFRGISFSSGGYSARYGQAMSSVLDLTTLDLPDKSTVNLGINMAGVYASGSKLWNDKTSLDLTGSYFNLAPFYGIASTNLDYYNVPTGASGSARFAWKPNKQGMFKLMTNFTRFSSGVEVPNPDSPGKLFRYGITNNNGYLNLSYNQRFGSKWNLYTAAGYAKNTDDIEAGDIPIKNRNDRTQFRLELKRYLAAKLSILAGTEIQHFSYRKNINLDTASYDLDFTETQEAVFLEADWSPTRWIAIRPGIRAEHSELLNQNTFAPRIALAIRAGMYGQFGFSSGIFYQLPDVPYLQYGYRPDMQEAIHYIANYQWIKGDRTLRAEVYYKDYRDLVREHVSSYDPNSYRTSFNVPDNSGYGYAKGFELFWRDKKLIKNVDYWVSYSYVDTRRLYRNYLAEVQPDFIATHNASLVAKYYIEKWTTQINATYSFATGRPYYNPSNTDFMGDRTPDYHNLSIAVNYLTHIKKWFTVIYAGVDNVTNQKNVFSYRYSSDGSVRYPQYPALFRNYFVGVNFSLTAFDRDEL
ncbi:MAG: TonB-dependent receptor [Bacteroidetes bacterium]|nr:TonB-dependent receptor [Bacteroidota bacterium]